MDKLFSPETAALAVAGVNLATDVIYNEKERSRATTFHEHELRKAEELHDKEIELAKRQHEESLRKAQEFHQKELKAAETLHKNETFLSKQTLLMSTLADMEMHFAQLDADLVNATKESERDMYDQNNQQLQTLILSSSVMVAALSTLLIQGIVPDGTNYIITIAFGTTCGIAYSLLFTSVVLCVETLRLASSFMVKRAKATGEHLVQAKEEMAKIMYSVRSREDANPPVNQTRVSHTALSALEAGLSSIQLPPSSIPHLSPNEMGMTRLDPSTSRVTPCPANGVDGETKDGANEASSAPPLSRSRSKFNAIAAGSLRDPNLVDSMFENIEHKIHKHMQRRIEMNKAFFSGTQGSFDKTSFDSFWAKYCEKPHDWAVRTFYGGTSFMLTATILWMWAQFNIQYSSFYGGLFGILPIGVSLPVGIYIYVFLSRRNVEHDVEDGLALQSSMAIEAFSDSRSKGGYDGLVHIAAQRGYARTPTYAANALGGRELGSASYDSRDIEGSNSARV